MLREIRIQNFKSLEDTTIPLGRVTVLIGENGGVKTNIAEAIGLMGATLAHQVGTAEVVARGLRSSPPSGTFSSFASSKNDQISLYVSVGDAPARHITIGWTGRSWSLAPIAVEGSESISELIDLLSVAEASSHDRVRMKRLAHMVRSEAVGEDTLDAADFVVYAPEAERLRTFMEEGQLRPLGARGEGLFRHLKELQTHHPDVFEKIVESTRLISWLDTIEIPSDLAPGERRLAIRDRHMLHELDQRSANEGFLFLLFIFTVMWSPETPKMFAIDNVDEALNPRLCREAMEQIVRIAKETDKQVILTTHNPALLDGLNLNDDEQVLVAVSRDADGRTRADRVPAPRARKGSKPVRLSHAFVQGYLGGLPTNF